MRRSNPQSGVGGAGTSERVLSGAVVVATDVSRTVMVQEPQACLDLYFPHPGNLVPNAPAQL